jgi:hypothetical protein
VVLICPASVYLNWRLLSSSRPSVAPSMFMCQSSGVDSLVLARFRFAVPVCAAVDIEMSEKRLPVDLARL